MIYSKWQLTAAIKLLRRGCVGEHFRTLHPSTLFSQMLLLIMIILGTPTVILMMTQRSLPKALHNYIYVDRHRQPSSVKNFNLCGNVFTSNESDGDGYRIISQFDEEDLTDDDTGGETDSDVSERDDNTPPSSRPRSSRYQTPDIQVPQGIAGRVFDIDNQGISQFPAFNCTMIFCLWFFEAHSSS